MQELTTLNDISDIRRYKRRPFVKKLVRALNRRISHILFQVGKDYNYVLRTFDYTNDTDKVSL